MLPVKNFFGEVEGRNVYSFLANLDYDLKNSQERIECVKKALYTEKGYPHPFWERIFEQTHSEETGLNTSYIKININSTDAQYSETNVAEVLERITDYILFADDVKRMEKEEGCEYKIYKDAKLFEKMNREVSLEGEIERLGSTQDGELTVDDVVAFIEGDNRFSGKYNTQENNKELEIFVKDRNSRRDTKQVIYTKDYQDEEVGEILRQYQNQINYMSNKLSENKSTMSLLEVVLEKNEIDVEMVSVCDRLGVKTLEDAQKKKVQLGRENKILTRQIGFMRQDMIDAKEMIKRPIRFKALLSGSEEPCYDSIDFMDVETVALALNMATKDEYDFKEDLDMILYIIEELVKDTELSPLEEDILKLHRLGLKRVTIANIISRTHNITCDRKFVARVFKKIAAKVVDTYTEQLKEYLVERKPVDQIKKCSKCGQWKLKEDFYSHPNTKDGLETQCKSC